MNNIIALSGHPIPKAVGEPNEDIINKLEYLLGEAKDGRILAIGYCAYRVTDDIQRGWVPGAYGFHLAAAVMALNDAYSHFINGGQDG